MNDMYLMFVVLEFMCILMDDEGLSWDDVWVVTKKIVAYTNYIVMSEAFEKWLFDLVEEFFLCYMEIIKCIDEEFIVFV